MNDDFDPSEEAFPRAAGPVGRVDYLPPDELASLIEERGNPLQAELEEATPKDSEYLRGYRDAARQAMTFMRESAFATKAYKGPLEFAYDCYLLALGWADIAGCRDQIGLARKWSAGRARPMTKANVNNLVKKFQALLRLPGTRSGAACLNMALKRKEQLK